MIKKKNLKSEYLDNGYVVINAFNHNELSKIKETIFSRIYDFCKIKDTKDDYPLRYYHEWFQKKKVKHDKLCDRTYRYLYPNKDLRKLFLENKKINNFLKTIGVKNYTMWDDSFGWIGFRLVRPNFNDGYPLSCKSMGLAKKVISCWMPLVGFQKTETLVLIKGSNKKKYESYEPKNSKFEKTDLRLSKKYKLKGISLELKPGDIIFYSPNTLHSESNPKREFTRVSLEFRYNPK